MTNNIKLPPLPERFSYTNSSAHWCYSRYTMVRDDLGAYVRAEDYDALRNASEALRAEVDVLKAENARLRDALEEIRNRSWIGVMRSNQFELEVALANICLFVDVVLWKENSNG